jgi:hypothetical protein
LNKTEVVEANLDPAQTSSMDQENSAMNASVKGNIISEQLGTLKDKEIMTINYQGPIIINLAGELILKIMKVSDLDENDRKIINLEVGYAVVDKKGGFKALRDNPSGFISRGHITIKRSGDRIILQDGVEGKSSKNGTIVSY